MRCHGEVTSSSLSELESPPSRDTTSKTQENIARINFYDLEIPIPSVDVMINILNEEFLAGDVFHQDIQPVFLFCSMIKKTIKENKEMVDKEMELHRNSQSMPRRRSEAPVGRASPQASDIGDDPESIAQNPE